MTIEEIAKYLREHPNITITPSKGLCKVCLKPFYYIREIKDSMRFTCNTCSDTANSYKRTGKRKLKILPENKFFNCKECDIEVKRTSLRHKFCSPHCRKENKKIYPITCAYCGKDTKVLLVTNKFCSTTCSISASNFSLEKPK